ncbi:MAG: LacI family transcriptional regulator [Akkermansiaceae bacterium]|jgi:DNA-binding LacI/PurR family transcriptional regulator|nr:LacI family transcriptional regulator [Akkermansiaceae bacterium]
MDVPDQKPLRRKCFARLTDVASLAGVSPSVAGMVINGSGKGNSRASDATRERVLAAARQLGYKPLQAARQLRGALTGTYGVLVVSAGDPLRSFLIQYLDTQVAALGQHIIICNTVDDHDPGGRFLAEVESLEHRRVDGVFCAVHHWWPGDRAALLQLHPNTVFFEDPGIPGAAVVAPDRAAAVRLALRHLAGRGRRACGLLVQNATSTTGRARVQAFQDECQALGLPFRPEWIFDARQQAADCGRHDPATRTWAFPVEVAEAAVEHLVGRQRVDAIVAHNDLWASVCLRSLRARGVRVPEQVAVIGYLNHYAADWTDPPLTSLDPCYEAAAQAMIEAMRRMVAGRPAAEQPQPVLVAPRLVQRCST